MNPPSALAGAMSRDRKPFTYTPGGLDLSEIKSSRMAARLMRNAMNEGVPEKPPQQIQSPPMPSTPIAVPNYNCMPVQVFPAFNLPANPKSLLRTRSNPSQPRDPPIQRGPPPQPQLPPQPQSQPSPFVNNPKALGTLQYDTFNKNTPTYTQVNNNRPVSMFEYGSSTPVNTYTPVNYENDVYKPSYPEISYDAEYMRMPPKNTNTITNVLNTVPTNQSFKNGDSFENYNKPVLAKEESSVPSIGNDKYRDYFEDKYKYHENKETPYSFNENNEYHDYSENIFKPANENKEIILPFIKNNDCQEYSENNCRTTAENKCPPLPSTLIETRNQGKFGNIYETATGNKENDLPITKVTSNQELEENHNAPLIESKETTVSLLEGIDNLGYSNEIYNTASETSLPCIDMPKGENSFESEIPPGIKNTESSIENETVNNEDNAENNDILINFSKHIADVSTFAPETIVSKPIQDLNGSDYEKKEVKVVKKQVIKSENKVEDQNGSEDQNGHSEVQAVSKLPAKKSAAKTETKVEITKTTLPDGSVEEVKKTITKTTIDGRTEIKTKTETTIIPKEDDEEEVEEEDEKEEMEEEENGEVKENGQESIIRTEEKSETTTTTSKKVVVVQDEQEEEQKEEVTEEEVEEPVTFVIKRATEKPETPKLEKKVEEVPQTPQQDEEETEENESEEVKEQEVTEETEENIPKEEVKEVQPKDIKEKETEDEVEEEEEEYEEAEEKEIEKAPEEHKDSEEPKETEKKVETEKEEIAEKPVDEIKEQPKTSEEVDNKQEQKQQITEEKQEIRVEKEEHKGEKQDVSEATYTIKVEKIDTQEQKVPLREPSVPLEKVEDVEIKPIGLGEFLTKTQTENTEIITNVTEKPTGLLTEINRIENIVTVNRTTKTLDRSYENITQQGIPTVKTYFTPHIDKISTPQPSRPYQPVYPPEPTTERRHSLLLERLSVERQMPSDVYQQSNNYQYSNQTVEQQRQWSQEPQAEVLTVSNVKPSQITNQQWYQPKENAIYNNVAPTPQSTPAAAWTQPKTQPQPVYQAQQQYQPPPQPQYQTLPQTQYQAPPQASPQPQYQPTYTENMQESSSNSYQNTYSTFSPKPTNWTSNTRPLSPIPTIITPSQPSPYSTSYLNKESSESYQKSTQNYSSSSYVPPPWEQDSNYVAPPAPQDYYQPPAQTSSFSPSPNQGWKPNLPSSKFSKTTPTAYIPPKPNQSFVKPVTAEPPKVAGRKTYYSEYERRYISVPESTYIPGESKFQPQPDPSPAYYYDNNEPAELVEPQWRRELREFTEKSQTETRTETNVNPPWQAETTYAKAPEPTIYTATPTWSQTVRPQSWRERSFESEFVSQEWPKTNTLGRGRPVSSYGKESVPQRARGVSVDRYNPNSYQSPVAAEHAPVQTHTHVPPAPHATGYHNPNVPAYHVRASAEPREQVSYQQPRNLREARASPFQSRSFKYLQWITGTED